jgi:hypothetical protein
MSPTAVATRAVAVPVRRGAMPARRPAPSPRSEPRRTLRLVETPARRVRRRRRHLGGAAFLTVVALLTIVAFHVWLAQRQLTIDTLQRQTDAAEHRYEQVRLQHAQLSSPGRVIARAAQLGLVAPAGPPVPVPVTGAAPSRAAQSSGTLDGWTTVKPTLGASP